MPWGARSVFPEADARLRLLCRDPPRPREHVDVDTQEAFRRLPESFRIAASLGVTAASGYR